MIGTHTRWSTASSFDSRQSGVLGYRYWYETYELVGRLYNDPSWFSQRQSLRSMLDAYSHAWPILRWGITSYQTFLSIAFRGFGGYVVVCHAFV